MVVTVVVLIVIVTLVQLIGDLVARRLAPRGSSRAQSSVRIRLPWSGRSAQEATIAKP